MQRAEDTKKFIKINRDLALEFRRRVFLLHNGDIYGNLSKEAEDAIKNHIKLMDKRITPDMIKKYNHNLDVNVASD